MINHYTLQDFEDLYGAKQQAQIFSEEFAEYQLSPKAGEENKRFLFGSLTLKNHLLMQLRSRGLEGSLEEMLANAKEHLTKCVECHECYKRWLEKIAYRHTESVANLSEKLDQIQGFGRGKFLSSEEIFRRFRVELDNSLFGLLEEGK